MSTSSRLATLYVLAAFFSLFVLGLADNVRGPVLPDLQRDLQLGDFAGSWFFSVTSLAGWLCAVGVRFWLPHWHPFRALMIWMVVQMAGLALMGFGSSYGPLLLGCAVFGLGMGASGIVQNILVGWGTEHRPTRQRQTYAGLHTMYGLASLAAPLWVTTLYGLGWGWNKVFLSVAVASGGVALWMWFVARPHTWDHRVKTTPLWAGGQWRRALPAGFVLGGYVAAEVMISSRLPLYLRRDLGWDVANANSLLTGFYILLCLGRLLFAIVPVGVSSRGLLAASASSSALCFAGGLWVSPVLFVVTGLTMSVFFPCLMAFVREEYPDIADFMTSFAMTCSPLAILVMHAAVGALSDQWGLQWALGLGPALCLAVSLFLFWGPFQQKLWSKNR